MLTLAFVTGTEPGKWFARYRERTDHGGLSTMAAHDPLQLVQDRSADLALLRLPDPRVDDSFHLVALYRETRGVAVSGDSVYAEVGEALNTADIAGEPVNYRMGDDGAIDYDELAAALQVVAANVGVAIAPRPVLKTLARKRVVPLELIDDTVPATTIALAWCKDRDNDAIQDFVGIAKGRTANSSRHAVPKRSARDKTLAKQARRAAAPGRRGRKRR